MRAVFVGPASVAGTLTYSAQGSVSRLRRAFEPAARDFAIRSAVVSRALVLMSSVCFQRSMGSKAACRPA
jgi:hypothetical protein